MIETGLGFRAARPYVAIATVGRIAVVEIEDNAIQGSSLHLANGSGVTIGAMQTSCLSFDDRVQKDHAARI